MRGRYKASELAGAVRCVACPTCHAKPGERCRLVRFENVRGFGAITIPHKRRGDAFYTDMAHFMASKMESEADEKGAIEE